MIYENISIFLLQIVNPVIEHSQVNNKKQRYNCSLCAKTFSRTFPTY